jgi:DDE superfamily endonuclease
VLKTQIAITPDGQIGEVSQTVPGSINDLTLLRQSTTLDRVPGGTMLDSGYQGIRKDRPDQLLYQAHRASRGHPLTPEQKAENRCLGHYRVRIEHALARLKIYRVLAEVYRHGRDLYNDVFRVVAALTNRRWSCHLSVAS